MSQEMYMCNVKGTFEGTEPNSVLLRLPAGCHFRHRGTATGPNDDPAGYAKAQARLRYAVIIHPSIVGSPEPGTGVICATPEQLGLTAEGDGTYLVPVDLS